MARKETVTKKILLDAAFEMLDKEGIEQVTARKLAAQANCSTQPIFRIYENMEQLYADLYTKACEFFQEFYSSFQKTTVVPFVTIGHVYIIFAQKYPNVFKFVFLNKKRYGNSMYDIINGETGNVQREIQAARSQGATDPSGLFSRMWMFIHGAACMSLTGDYDLSETDTVNMLKDAYTSFR
ncbi:MAG: TetR/AcrR family transcriptional regulator [Lachnospiraceae bacterium]|nr:TetR/AcrR family transcriptional regulator [Lachnospiraceae bacterium]